MSHASSEFIAAHIAIPTVFRQPRRGGRHLRPLSAGSGTRKPGHQVVDRLSSKMTFYQIRARVSAWMMTTCRR
ncbi:hypothetical protein M8494_19385 [Serratia ureilytica]